MRTTSGGPNWLETVVFILLNVGRKLPLGRATWRIQAAGSSFIVGVVLPVVGFVMAGELSKGDYRAAISTGPLVWHCRFCCNVVKGIRTPVSKHGAIRRSG